MNQTIKHLGIIMDGNRRWAKSQGLPSFEGHRAGYKKVGELLEWCREAKIETLTLFAFSTENWQRAKDEVDFLMGLFYQVFNHDIKKLHENKVRVRLIGRKETLPDNLAKAIKAAEELTQDNIGYNLNLAINYGGRAELLDAFKKILKNPPEEITEETITNNLYTAGQSDPDLIIRTSGEQRLSGFLTWQSAYSELLFIQHHWPEFSQQDFNDALTNFANRHRRFGK
ncbi:di-trans,poly-cis-decaprenylcistransferase [Candidatus Falkowbacteria bacterium]|uniref:Isoprenyl transferase n=1 Tax=Candidatus Falkowbacteria bacterium CG10_big_fil_rev_8_21_14_0_10_37_18 TaxID=1974562 RepID=A0A2H0V9E9_9BACT|nr:di-trans,poly-cis-decaprenylcistransferase [Candidatus Falkowbacteria bacterium]NCQ13037.1 di-trans,poly-cis-decaprenylcistransferase [Candidatus Falkowbacteria bacterium]OIO05920.1 MAG: di-trans,poly-cis-decaprenylcistransferase [Candidatus Falkowbacteria bacterium CG1_02_37_21]PIR95718.1 MAG: di-trans,poly-cis-decaprenylcistransferase [Candidatus Falkowbacteria bacterium CG10_big_fil_rev_8_21_14_0_10_37_18]